jgi:hypothetical protein
MEKQELDE